MPSIGRTDKTFTAGSAVNMLAYLRKITAAELLSANLPIPTFATTSGKGCELNSPPLAGRVQTGRGGKNEFSKKLPKWLTGWHPLLEFFSNQRCR